MRLTVVAGARPNFMKIAPMLREIRRTNAAGQTPITVRLVHTGQHYDKNMSGQFFDQLEIPPPDANLEAGSGTQAEQTGQIMVRFEKDLLAQPCDIVVVVGDVTSTMACTIVAKKLNTTVAHVEAGIRSFDMTMPEEINRMVTDALADLFFTTSKHANEQLHRTGIPEERIHFVGNTMIDSLAHSLPRLTPPELWGRLGLKERGYTVLTLHRPANVDDPSTLKGLLDEIAASVQGLPVIFPVHPRTQKALAAVPGWTNVHQVAPMGYFEFMYLVKNARAVLTDSGGVQEETTYLGVPCLTLRDNTERPETTLVGSNELIGTKAAAIAPALLRVFAGTWKKGGIPELWDGRASERIVAALRKIDAGRP